MAATEMAERVILLPIRVDEVRDKEGALVESAIPELWGSKVDVIRVKINYHDVGKFLVRGAADVVAALAEQSRAHFAEAWAPREERDV